jgi:hypothetical protein
MAVLNCSLYVLAIYSSSGGVVVTSDTGGGATGVYIYCPGVPVSSVTNSTTVVPDHTYLGYVPDVSAIIQLIPY